MGAKPGYDISVEGNYYFNKLPVETIGGLKLTFASFSSIPYEWKTEGDYVFNNAHFVGMRFLTFKFGPIMRVALGKKTALRLYDQIGLAVCWNGSWENTLDYVYYDDEQSRYSVHDVSTLQLHSGSGLKNEIGVSFSYGRLMANISFRSGKLNFRGVHYLRYATIREEKLSPLGYYYYYETLNGDADLDVDPKISTNTISFSLGYLF